MKVHYINILLFALPLNILEHNKNEPHTTPNHTQTTRSLCECELYELANYDNDPQMKEVMQQFEDRTSQRFHEYDERMKTTRQKCKERCDKEIQKIILKDKLEKQMVEQFSTLQTDIQSDSIPTCICKKSVADKVEKTCLKCGGILGTTVPQLGILGGISTHMLTTAATSAAIDAGMKAVVDKLKDFVNGFSGNTVDLTPIVNPSSYNCGNLLLENAKNLTKTTCMPNSDGKLSTLCAQIQNSGSISTFNGFAEAGTDAYNTTWATKTAEINSFNIAMMASIIAIVVIVLVMVIVYLILRYRRKEIIKKKLQYIKLLKE
ncbi:rifin [Plasmodium falciparum IGH-CR14]|uniref:Rifin n=1 Tax=Plasmodium falciparum IGH-CR14 TaxID=580059 RepID=A0A0L1I571_PLAFA|nr:rifin [Plasmodium falciparum IGH-CR14]